MSFALWALRLRFESDTASRTKSIVWMTRGTGHPPCYAPSKSETFGILVKTLATSLLALSAPNRSENRDAWPHTAKRFECGEVFGGNRAVDLPISLPGISGYVRSIPCQSRVGGDIHYISTCGSGLMSRFAIADVVGHGADVESVSSHAHTLLRRFMNALDHSDALQTLNDRLSSLGLEALTTAAVFTFFPPTRTLSFSYAGHPPAWYYSQALHRWFRLELRPGQKSDTLDHTNFPLAVSGETEYSIDQIKVMPGDKMVVISDGLTDALNDECNIFGARRVERILNYFPGLGSSELINALLSGLSEFCGSKRFTHDDVTVIALEFEPISRAECLRLFLRNRVARPFRSSARCIWRGLRWLNPRSASSGKKVQRR